MPMNYEATFHVTDATDWTLILTYLTYAPKPNLLIAENITIPDGFWSKISKSTTIVNFASQSVISLRPYDAIFFASMEDLSHPYVDYAYKVLQSVYKASYSMKEHKEILQELRVANAGLVWTRESGVCWYDPVQTNGEKLTGKQLSELFSFLSTVF